MQGHDVATLTSAMGRSFSADSAGSAWPGCPGSRFWVGEGPGSQESAAPAAKRPFPGETTGKQKDDKQTDRDNLMSAVLFMRQLQKQTGVGSLC